MSEAPSFQTGITGETQTPLTQFQTAMSNPAIGCLYPKQRQAFNALLLQWMHFIAMIISCFCFDPITLAVVGVAGSAITASCYNDYYKLSMAPTIFYLQKLRGGVAIGTFAVDIREKSIRDLLDVNTDGITDAVIQALNALQHRTFDYNVILETVKGKPCEAFFHTKEGRAIFLNDNDIPRTLISTTSPHGVPVYPETVICSVPIMDPTKLAPGQVVISVFMALDAKTGEQRLHIEATGEVNKVSYLETTMMQAVYQTALNHHLAKRQCSFGQWLYEALFRFYLSATFAGTQCPGMTGFLFAGRRTGHFLLLLLQTFLAKKIPGAKIAGTSSFDAVYFLINKLGVDPASIIGSVGTHAHEIQMLAQALFAWLDKSPANPEHLPLWACVSTYLYYLTANKGMPGPMPILPDTLGTRSFMKAAECFMVHPMKDGVLDTSTWVSLLSLINSARQDSGDLGEFARTMHEYPDFKGSLMASEIDDKEKLLEASDQGYSTFGSGGFKGDSEKVWNVTNQDLKYRLSASMAVKLVRVWLMQPESTVRCPNPVKLGDGKDRSKVTLDTLLPKSMFDEVIADAELVKSSAEAKPHSDHLFYCKVTNKVTVTRDDGVQL